MGKASQGDNRVLRGGSWNDGFGCCRVSDRLSIDPSYEFFNRGFRVVRQF